MMTIGKYMQGQLLWITAILVTLGLSFYWADWSEMARDTSFFIALLMGGLVSILTIPSIDRGVSLTTAGFALVASMGSGVSEHPEALLLLSTLLVWGATAYLRKELGRQNNVSRFCFWSLYAPPVLGIAFVAHFGYQNLLWAVSLPLCIAVSYFLMRKCLGQNFGKKVILNLPESDAL